MKNRPSSIVDRQSFVFSEAAVQRRLVEVYFFDPARRSVGFCPNVRYLTADRHGTDAEADLLIVAANGLVAEYEIKCSRDDFWRDFSLKAAKHRILADAHRTRQPDVPLPNRLMYVVPQALALTDGDVPPYAGLMTISDTGTLRCVKSPPLIHRVRFAALQNLTTPLSWRLSRKM